MTIAAFILTFSIILSITIEDTHLQEKQPYVPKRLRPHKSMWIKSMINLLMGCAEPLVSTINKLKVRRRRHTRGARRVGSRRFKYKTVPPQVPRDLSSPKSIPVMTTTWSNWTSDSCCAGTIASGTYHLIASSNWPIRGNYQNGY